MSCQTPSSHLSRPEVEPCDLCPHYVSWLWTCSKFLLKPVPLGPSLPLSPPFALPTDGLPSLNGTPLSVNAEGTLVTCRRLFFRHTVPIRDICWSIHIHIPFTALPHTPTLLLCNLPARLRAPRVTHACVSKPSSWSELAERGSTSYS